MNVFNGLLTTERNRTIALFDTYDAISEGAVRGSVSHPADEALGEEIDHRFMKVGCGITFAVRAISEVATDILVVERVATIHGALFCARR
jgi:hypothetical protein